MDAKCYGQWWQLHLRKAKGEPLLAAEQVNYAAGLAELEGQEGDLLGTVDTAALRALKSEVAHLEADRRQLLAKSNRLDRQIQLLESAYMALTGFELGGPRHAPSPI